MVKNRINKSQKNNSIKKRRNSIKKCKNSIKKRRNSIKKRRNSIKKRRKTKKTRKHKIKGGSGNLFQIMGIFFILFAVANGTHYYMTACAGNTCRSPMAEKIIQSLISDPNLVSSFGINVRTPNSSMAPFTEKIASDLCNNNPDCLKRVENHKSQQLDTSLVHNILDNPENTLQIIPMDDKTADGVIDLLQKSGLSLKQLSRITVGINCDVNGVCEHKSANAPDPFYDKGTNMEATSYKKTYDILSDVIENELLKKTPVNQQRWQVSGDNMDITPLHI